MAIMTEKGLMSGRQYVQEVAKDIGLDVDLTSPGDNNTHYVFKDAEGNVIHDARGLNAASIWLDGFRKGTAHAVEVRAKPVRAPRKKGS